MSRLLVACYSLTGTTLALAQEAARLLDATFVRIEDASPRRGAWGIARAVFDARLGRRPAITDLPAPAAFDGVVLAAPVWASRLAPPLATYAQRLAPRQRYALLVTYGGSGADGACARFASAVGWPAAARLCVTQQDVRAGAYGDRLRAFVAAVASADGQRAAEALESTAV